MEYLDDEEIDEIVEKYNEKSKPKKVEVPTFLMKREDVLSKDEELAILNNVPGNKDIEEMKHLNGIEEVAINLTNEEWQRYLYYAPHELITAEIERRLKSCDTVNDSVKSLYGFLGQVKMINQF